MIPTHEEKVSVKHRRTALAVRVERVHPTQIPLPQNLSIEIEAVQSAGSKEHINPLPVTHG